MLCKALSKANELLNDKSLHIFRYTETNDYYLFEYRDQNRKPIFDNTIIKVDKLSNITTFITITEHLEDINNSIFIKINN